MPKQKDEPKRSDRVVEFSADWLSNAINKNLSQIEVKTQELDRLKKADPSSIPDQEDRIKNLQSDIDELGNQIIDFRRAKQNEDERNNPRRPGR